MDSDLKTYLGWLGDHGVSFAVSPGLRREPDHRGALAAGTEPVHRFPAPGRPPIREHREVAAGRAADHATDAVARALVLDALGRCRNRTHPALRPKGCTRPFPG
ncbi:MAG: hypothetical protein Kow0092_03410 [Deferrisomatales bacterium]